VHFRRKSFLSEPKKNQISFFHFFKLLLFLELKCFKDIIWTIFVFLSFCLFRGIEKVERGRDTENVFQGQNIIWTIFFFFAPKVSNSERLRAKTETDRPNKFFTFFFLFKLTLRRILLGSGYLWRPRYLANWQKLTVMIRFPLTCT